MANYELYASDGETPISDPAETPQPIYASWETRPIGRFASGMPRYSGTFRVEWRFGTLSAEQYQTLIENRAADGNMKFKTFRQALGGTPAQWVKCRGYLDAIVSGTEFEGEYYGVFLVFERVVVEA